jgi:hypothetical protein
MAILVILYILFAAYGWCYISGTIVDKLVDWQLKAKTKHSKRSREAISMIIILLTGIGLLLVFLLIGLGLGAILQL